MHSPSGIVAKHHIFAMTRYRIVTTPHPSAPGDKVYDVEQWRPVFWFMGFWDYVERFDFFESAKCYIEESKTIYNAVEIED